MSEKILRVQMLGGFALRYGGEAVVFNKAGTSKSIRLLQMLLLSLPGGMSKSEILDNLYGWNEKTDSANRNKNLNNLIYRLKGQLVSGGLPEKEYVEIREGRCFFKTEFPIELDVKELEETIGKAKSLQGEERIRLLQKANEMYRGELLPASLSEAWFFQKRKYYKELYLWTIRELEQEFLKTNDYKNRMLLYSRAAAIYPFENWQTRLMRCNLEVYHYDEALEIYRETAELYAREMGSAPTAEMQECFETLELMDENHKRDTGDINSWKDMDKAFIGRKSNIRRAIFEEPGVRGAYYCTYPSFVDYCRMVVRAKERSEFSAVLMFLTLSQKKKNVGQKSMDLSRQMQILKSAIGDSLRLGDAYTRYGNRHFILMLAKAELESCDAIFQRIEAAYQKKSGKGELWYYADLTQELSESAL